MTDHSPDRAPRIGVISLGCAKALVDTERILTRLLAEGYRLSPDYAGADLVLVNTCGFLRSARAESLEAIGEALAENGRVVVTGCLGALPEEIRAVHPQVLAITGPQRYEETVKAVRAALEPPRRPRAEPPGPAGVRLTPPHYAWLKISEGCSNACSFCIIPRLRGPLVSRRPADVLREAERLVEAGVKELLVISQDTAAYGRDIRHAPDEWKGRTLSARIRDLARELGGLGARVRLLYLYPYPHVDELVELMAGGLIAPYLDAPLQHAAPGILRAMRRPADQERMLRRIENWRRICPGLAIRSTFITGFPGETEADFRFLLDWLRQARLDRVGCFAYEDVPGAPANALPGQLPPELRAERRDRLMEVQAEISASVLAERVGSETVVLVDEIRREEGIIAARGPWDAPEVDGETLIPLHRAPAARPGDFLKVRITGSATYDLEAEPA